MDEADLSEPVILDVDRRTDPASIEEAIAELVPERDSVVLWLPLPEASVASVAAGLERQPEVLLNVEGWAPGRPGLTLDCLEQFPRVRNLRVSVYDALDLSPIRHLHDLRKLRLGATKRRSLSLAFLRETPLIEELEVDGTGGRDLDAVASLERLWYFELKHPRVKTLDGLRGHPTLESLEIILGGIRDLAPLATIPNLRMLQLWGIRSLDADDLAPVGDCQKLGLLSLDRLPNIRNLAALARGPAETLRFLDLTGLKALETFRPLADCKRLECVSMGGSRPADRRLDLLTAARRLKELLVADSYTKSELEAARKNFAGHFFWCRGTFLVGDWNVPHHDWLDLALGPRRQRRTLELLRSETPT